MLYVELNSVVSSYQGSSTVAKRDGRVGLDVVRDVLALQVKLGSVSGNAGDDPGGDGVGEGQRRPHGYHELA